MSFLASFLAPSASVATDSISGSISGLIFGPLSVWLFAGSGACGLVLAGWAVMAARRAAMRAARVEAQLARARAAEHGLRRGAGQAVAALQRLALSAPSGATAASGSAHRAALIRLAEELSAVTDIDREVIMTPAPLPLGPALARARAETLAAIAPASRRIVISPAAERAVLLADGRAMHQVLSAVLSSATLASDEGGVIACALTSCPGGTALVVEDEGAGRTIFDTHGQAAESRGLGLGLSLARQLLAAHDGTLLAESMPGIGTRVMVMLPAKCWIRPAHDGETQTNRTESVGSLVEAEAL